MTTYNYSLVLLIPSEHLETINTFAEEFGWGPNSLSIPLVDQEGSDWFGAHVWVSQSFLDLLESPPEGAPLEALSALKTSAVDGGEPLDNWTATLSLYGLTPKEIPWQQE